MSVFQGGQDIGNYKVQSLIRENLYTETYRAEDEEFFQLAFPGVFDVTEDNRDQMLEAANKTNSNMKVAKVVCMGDSVWVLFEILLDQSPEVDHIIPRALSILQHTRQNFYEALQ